MDFNLYSISKIIIKWKIYKYNINTLYNNSLKKEIKIKIPDKTEYDT